ncbi:hypothetical protein CLOM_g21708 [Closterium sp. NIES-68]|nr:hypothetical protein CLOM_g21708 [Closterium sp. NIES-68]
MDETDFLKALALYPTVRSRDFNENDLPAAAASSQPSDSQKTNSKKAGSPSEEPSAQQPETDAASLGFGEGQGSFEAAPRSFWDVLQERVEALLPPRDAGRSATRLKSSTRSL